LFDERSGINFFMMKSCPFIIIGAEALSDVRPRGNCLASVKATKGNTNKTTIVDDHAVQRR